MAERARLAALRRDGATVPVEITLSPVPTALETFVLAVIRDAAEPRPRDDLASLALGHHGRPCANRRGSARPGGEPAVPDGTDPAGAGGLPGETARARLAEALDQLDDVIQELRDYAFASGDPGPSTPLSRGWPVG